MYPCPSREIRETRLAFIGSKIADSALLVNDSISLSLWFGTHLRLYLRTPSFVISVAGLVAGSAYSIPNKRGLVPVMAAGVAGSLADVMWGLMVDCQAEVDAYKESRGMK
jgi:hypothetical protein